MITVSSFSKNSKPSSVQGGAELGGDAPTILAALKLNSEHRMLMKYKYGGDTMKTKTLLWACAAVLFAAMVAGCVSTPQKQAIKDMKKLSYTNQPAGELELINRTEYDLVVFAGTVDRKNILGGIHHGDIRSFDFRPFVSSNSGAFLCRAVKTEVYAQKGGLINEADVIWAKLVTYGSAKSSFTVLNEVGGEGKLLFENASPYPVEVRLNGTTGTVLTTLPPYCKEQYVYVKPNPRGYVYYPTYLMYDRDTGKINSITGKEEDGQPARPAVGAESPQNVIFPVPTGKLFGARVAYLTIKNESGRAFIFRDDNTELLSQNGYAMINSGETLTFELDATEAGKTYRVLNADFRVGSTNNRYIKLFNGDPVSFKAGVEYEIAVYNQNGTVKTEIESSSERLVEYNLSSQLDLE